MPGSSNRDRQNADLSVVRQRHGPGVGRQVQRVSEQVGIGIRFVLAVRRVMMRSEPCHRIAFDETRVDLHQFREPIEAGLRSRSSGLSRTRRNRHVAGFHTRSSHEPMKPPQFSIVNSVVLSPSRKAAFWSPSATAIRYRRLNLPACKSIVWPLAATMFGAPVRAGASSN
jgi:hypothetical protein